MAGYSGTPLASKLGVKPGMVLQAVHAPENYRELLAPLPDGASIATRAVAKADIVHHGLKLVVRKELRGGNRR